MKLSSRKIVLLLVAFFALSIGVQAQQSPVAQDSAYTESGVEVVSLDDAPQYTSFFYNLKMKFIEGGVEWMTPIALCLILGLAIAFERIIFLHLSTIKIDKFTAQVNDALAAGGVEAAMEVCRNTRGPVASIFYQGLSRADQGLEVVERSVVSSGSVQTGRLESGLPWISLFIALAPMLGFMGTVAGMIESFDAIQMAGDISPSLVAGGIKVALLTTMAGLIVGAILQFFYSYIISKIDSLVISMEDSSITLVDMLLRHSRVQR